MELVDTHCHIHDSEFAEKSEYSQKELIDRAKQAGVSTLVCVGTSLKSSREAAGFVQTNDNCYFSVALHPHEAETYSIEELDKQMDQLSSLVESSPKNLVAIGECGLDYFYHDNAEVRTKQKKLLRRHLDIAVTHHLPLIFHVRNAQKETEQQAFDDFFSIIDEYSGIEGVVHSFSATSTELNQIVSRGLYVGLNGIMTFTKDEKQLEAAKNVPIDNLLLETDAPFLTPAPLRGTINEPKHVILITQFLSELRGESQALLAKQTTKNAKTLFKL
jgi:TatD DNase family protein